METTILVGVLALLLGGIVAFLLIRGSGRDKGSDETGLRLILDQMNELSRVVDQKMSENTREIGSSMRTQLSESASLIREVTKGLTRLDETNRQVVSFATELQNLQDILKNPKQRGILGEYYLETLLSNILPPTSYQMQYTFSNGEIVDAVVFIKDKIIPIDSKFSLENYNRLSDASDKSERDRLEKLFISDLKKRIEETAKYIRPGEGTLDFAFMFIPHEAIYYDLLVNKVGGLTEDSENLIQRAAGKYKVIIVSPTSFLAYLQTVLQGLKAMQIEETAQDIIKRVGELAVHLKKYEEYHAKLGNSLGTTVNHFNSASKEFKKVDKDVTRLTGSSLDLEVAALEGPEGE